MKIVINIFSLVACLFYSIGLWGCDMESNVDREKSIMTNRMAVTLVGASVGQDWNLGEFAERVGDRSFRIQSVAVWDYDKSEMLEEVLAFPKRKFRLTRTYLKSLFQEPPPAADIIILKECAAYFPGDVDRYKSLMMKWTKRVLEENRDLVLATVVPVTRVRAESKAGQVESIWGFNDWVREYAGKQGIPLLDLETVVREDASRYLRKDLSTDGLHLNKLAYKILDEYLLRTLHLIEDNE